jgi:hypothetical protein
MGLVTPSARLRLSGIIFDLRKAGATPASSDLSDRARQRISCE